MITRTALLANVREALAFVGRPAPKGLSKMVKAELLALDTELSEEIDARRQERANEIKADQAATASGMTRSRLVETLHDMAEEMGLPGYGWDRLMSLKTSTLTDMHAYLSEFYAYWVVKQDANAVDDSYADSGTMSGDLFDLITLERSPFSRIMNVHDVKGSYVGCIIFGDHGYTAYRPDTEEEGDIELGRTPEFDVALAMVAAYVA